MSDENAVTIILPSVFLIIASRLFATFCSEMVCPGLSALVESENSARTFLLPYDAILSNSAGR